MNSKVTGLTFLFLRLCSPSLSVSSEAVMALGRSCLLANTSRVASLNSSSCNCPGDNINYPIKTELKYSTEILPSLTIFCSSSWASLILSRSLLSTTKIKPWVFCNEGNWSIFWHVLSLSLSLPGSSDARAAWSCLGLQRPTRWSKCSCTRQSQRWIL